MIVHVECRPDLHGEMEPVAFHLGGLRVVVLQIIDRWLSKDCSYFKLTGNDNATWILRHDYAHNIWELTLYQAHFPPTAR